MSGEKIRVKSDGTIVRTVRYSGPGLDEPTVTNSTVSYLIACGEKIIQVVNGRRSGVDIISVGDGDQGRLYVEAKGEVPEAPEISSKNTKVERFSDNHAYDYVRRAYSECCRQLSLSGGRSRVGLALPDYHKYIDWILEYKWCLRKLGILVFWVCGVKKEMGGSGLYVVLEDWDSGSGKTITEGLVPSPRFGR